MGFLDKVFGTSEERAASYGTPDSAAAVDNSVMDSDGGERLVMPQVDGGRWTVADYSNSYSSLNHNIKITLIVRGNSFYRTADTTSGVKVVQKVVDRIYDDYQAAIKEALQKDSIMRMITNG